MLLALGGLDSQTKCEHESFFSMSFEGHMSYTLQSLGFKNV